MLEARLEALGCPPPEWGGLRAVNASVARRRAWREADPLRAAEYDLLVAELEAVLARREAADLEARREARLDDLALAAGVRARDLVAAREGRDTAALVAAREWLASDPREALVLEGPPGTGKSVALAWLVLTRLRSGQRAAYCTAAQVARASTWGEGGTEVARWVRTPLLALDEVGRGVSTDYGRQALWALLDERHGYGLPTALAGNLSPAELAAHLGPALVDRLRCGRVVRLTGASLRGTTCDSAR